MHTVWPDACLGFCSPSQSFPGASHPRERANKGVRKKDGIPTAELSAEPLVWGKIFLSSQRTRQSSDAPEPFSLGQAMWTASVKGKYFDELQVSFLFSVCCYGAVFKISLPLFYSLRKLIRKSAFYYSESNLGFSSKCLWRKPFYPAGSLSKLKQRTLRWAVWLPGDSLRILCSVAQDLLAAYFFL